jgi:hypothetical protein
MLLQDVHWLSVLRKGMSVKIIEALTFPDDHERMEKTTAHQVLVLGATGKTGSCVAAARYLIPGGITDCDGVLARQVQEQTVSLLGRYSDFTPATSYGHCGNSSSGAPPRTPPSSGPTLALPQAWAMPGRGP